MCLSKAYVDRDSKIELLMKEIASLEVGNDGRLLLKTLFGQQRKIAANIKKVDFLTHSIFLEKSR